MKNCRILLMLCFLANVLLSPISVFATETTTEVTSTETDQENNDKSQRFSVAANHAIAIEANTGKILYEKNSDEVTGTASTSKLLTAYLIYDAVAKGEASWEDVVNVSNYAYSLSLNTEVANVPLDARAYTLQELFTAMMVNSANGAAVALAEHISGTEPRFVDAMSKKVTEWGIEDAKLVNATGLSNHYLGDHRYPDSAETDENLMSAKSLAIITQRLLLDYPEVSELTSLVTAPFSYTTISNWNLLLPGATYSRPKVDGLMTGTSEKSGSSLVASGTENYMRVVTVVLGAHNGTEDSNARFLATHALFDHIKEHYYFKTMIRKGDAYNKNQSSISNGKKPAVTAVAKEDFLVVQEVGAENESFNYSSIEETLEAPVKEGTTVGQLTFDDDGYLKAPPQLEMVAKNSVERANFYKVWWNNFVNWVNKEL
ncbi:serine hydrolase [Streptococcus merionis]|uniref:serine hydrolase n=1 Tax=Streptococcus merionis TaxID=400065 RepID=UPI003518DC0A